MHLIKPILSDRKFTTEKLSYLYYIKLIRQEDHQLTAIIITKTMNTVPVIGLLLGNLKFKMNKRTRLIIINIIKSKHFGFIFKIHHQY